jgi:cobalamin biosynthesis protein CobC
MLPARTVVQDAALPEISAEHGGDLAAIRGAFPDAPQPWLDLSTGINPWPYPVGRIAPELWHRLPASDLEQAALRAAAAYYGVVAADRLALAPGSQALIQWLPRLRPRSRVIVLGPTYSEHARSWLAAGHETHVVDALPEIGRDVDVLVVARPNNPDGRSAPLAWLDDAAGRLQRRGGWLILDEAFADTGNAPSAAATLRSDAAIGLRSFGKFFGVAGGRLGVAVAAPAIAAHLREALGPWCVSGPMLAIAARAFADRAWIARTRQRLDRAAGRLDRIAALARLRPVGGTSLFRLYETARAPMLFDVLARHGIYVRRFAEHETWLRFGLPPDSAAERRLAAALSGLSSAAENS